MDIKQLILNRRTVKPSAMNGQKLPESVVLSCLEAARWAPTHARTEPWFFEVFEGEALKNFCLQHAALYKEHTPEERFTNTKYQGLVSIADTISHLIVAIMKRTPMAKIPVSEEYAAVAASIQNILLVAHQHGAAAIWNTGGMVLSQAMKEYFGLHEEDAILGFLYLGYADTPAPEGSRKKSLETVMKWHR